MNTGTRMAESPFDNVARQYDAEFTDTPLGRRQRHIVHRYLERVVRPGMQVLELNCGTGEDALWLAERGAQVIATDASGEMVEVARAKGERSPHGKTIEFRQMKIEDLHDEPSGRYDLILSNFDGLNCIPDLASLPDQLARILRPGGQAVLVFMSPVCAMEILYLGLRGRWRSMLQRMRPGGLAVHIGNGRHLRTYFHPVGQAVRAFGRRFALRRVEAVGLVTPPTLMRDFYHRHEGLFRRFFRVEDLLSTLPPFNRMGDHVMIHIQVRS